MNPDMTVAEFCDHHEACDDGREWAMANCASMQNAWEIAKPDWLLWIGTRKGVLPDRELRLFAVRCARSVQHLMTDARSVAALDVAERHANGAAIDDEMSAAWSAAGDARAAARSAAGDAARAAAWSAAGDAARAAAWSAAGDAAWSAAWSAAGDARAAAWDAASAAAWAAFAADMRKLTPHFRKEAAK